MSIKTPAPVNTGQSAPAPVGPLDKGPAPVQQGTATGVYPQASSPTLPQVTAPKKVAINSDIPGDILPVFEQPVDVTTNVQVNIPATSSSRYVSVYGNGNLVVSAASTLNFFGNGVTVTSGNSSGSAQISITGGGGNATIDWNNINNNILPSQTATYNLGSTSNRWASVFTVNVGATGDVSAVGNVIGNYIFGNGSQLTGISSNYGNANVAANLAAFGSNPISTSGNITGGYFIGNGSQLTGITSTPVNTGNIGFVGDTMYDFNGLTVNNGDLSHGSTSSLVIPGNGNTTNPTQLTNTYGNIVLTTGPNPGNTVAWTFDNTGGLNLAGAGVVRRQDSVNIVSNGYSQLQWVDSGNLNLPNPNDTGGITHWAYVDSGGVHIETNYNAPGGSHFWNFDTSGALTFPGGTIAEDNIEATGNFGFEMPANIGFGILANAGSQEWTFDTDGKLTAPGEVYGQYYTIRGANGPGTDIGSLGYAGNIVDVYGIEGVRISTIDESGPFWQFSIDGNLTAPGSVEIGTGNTGVQLRSNQTGTGFYTTIAGITNGSSTVIVTLNDVEFIEGDQGTVTITGVVGETQANGFWGWQAVDVDQIQLYTDGTFSTPVNGTTWGAYDSGGLAVSSGYNELDIQGGSVSIISGAGKYWSFTPNGQTVFPTLSIPRGDTSSGNITGYALVGGDGNNEFIISTPNGVDNGNSQRLVINPGQGAGVGEGGDIYLWAGRGGPSGGSGGDIKIRGGQGLGEGGAGGYIRMEAGDGDGAGGGAPGFIEITSGTGGTGQNGGYVRILAGQGAFGGGDANITGGVGQAGPGGVVNISGGVSGNGLAEYGNVNITSGASTWVFDNTGKLTVPGEGYIRAINDTIELKSYDLANSLGYGLRVGTSGGLYLEQGNAPAYLTVDSNAGNAQIYTASGQSGAAGKNLTIYAGSADEFSYNTSTGGNIYLQAGAGGSNDGGGGGQGGWVNITSGASLDPAGVPGNVTINTGPNTWNFDYNGTLNLPEGTSYIGSAANLLSLHANDSEAIYISAISGGISAETNGNITLISNVDGVTNYAWTFDNTGNLTLPTNTFSVNYANGTPVSIGGGGGSYGNADVTALLAALGSNVISGTGNITTTANISGGYILGNGSLLTGITTTYGNANVAANLAAFGSNPISTTGNITGGYIFGNGSQLTGLPATYGNANVVANLAALGSNPISTTGNVTAGYFVGNGSLLTGITGTYGNANVAANLAAFGSNPISTTGNVTSGNLNLSGNIVDTGALSIITGSNGNIALLPNGTGIVTASGAVSAAGNITSAANISGTFFIGNGSLLTGITSSGGTSITNGTSNVVVASSANVTTAVTGNVITTTAATGQFVTGLISATGNITGNYFVGNGSLLTGITSAGTSISNGTSNISVLSSANITVGVAGTGNVAVFATDGMSVTGNVTATANVQGANLIGTVRTAAQTSITSLGTLTSLTVSGSATFSGTTTALALGTSQTSGTITVGGTVGTGVITVGQSTASQTIAIGNGVVGIGNTRTINIGTTAGTGTTAIAIGPATGNSSLSIGAFAPVTIANTGNAALSVVGNITGGNIITAGSTGNITGANVISATTFSATGNIAANNISTSNTISAFNNMIINSNGAEGGQLVMAWANISGITGQANSTWNVDVGTGNSWRVFYQNAVGATNEMIIANSTSNIIQFATVVKTIPTTFAALPSAATAGAGARAFITDANTVTFASQVTGGASNNMPVFSDGTNWLVG